MDISQRKEIERNIRRNDIIEAAESLFIEKGYEHATMDDIAKKSAFTKKTIYAYFSSKEELYYEIMLRGFEKFNRLIDDRLSELAPKVDSKPGGIEKIKLLGHAFIDFSLIYPYHYRTIMDYENKEFEFQHGNEGESVGNFYTAGQYSIELLEMFIKEGISENEILADSDSKIMALVLWSSMTGLLGMMSRKEKYIAAYFNENISFVLEEGFKLILNSIKKEKVD